MSDYLLDRDRDRQQVHENQIQHSVQDRFDRTLQPEGETSARAVDKEIRPEPDRRSVALPALGRSRERGGIAGPDR